jgi:hypothetical protein
MVTIFSMIKGVVEIAEEISKKSPVAVQGTKVSIVFGRDHSVQEGLNQIVSSLCFILVTNNFVYQSNKKSYIILKF